MRITEVRKEDDIYYQGPFWIIANSAPDIQRGNFTICGIKEPCYYSGKYTGEVKKSSLTHKNAWENIKSEINPDIRDKIDYRYFPRGRVAIYEGTAWIHINSFCNTPKIINSITDCYGIKKLNVEVECNDETQGNHYDFSLK